jgi:hypothetical protein
MTLGSAGDNARLRDRLARLLARRFAPSAAQGAQPILSAATSPDVQGGDFIGPGGRFGVRGLPGAFAPVTAPGTRISRAACGRCQSN